MASNLLIVVAGPTAAGKTTLAIDLAQRWNTEIVSADARQVYREMEIGTAKPTADDLKAVKHHFIGSQSIRDDYDAGTYGREARACIGLLFRTHPVVILCGGSGLYISAVCDGFDDMPAIADGIRDRIMAGYEEKGLGWLQDEVKQKDPEYFAVVDQRNPHRLVRALEVFEATGQPMSALRSNKKDAFPHPVVKVGVTLERGLLYQRIDARVDAMLAAGLEAEARKLLPQSHLNALQTVGYSELFDYFNGITGRDEAIRLIKRNTRHYAKRQLTWFKRDSDIAWFSPDQPHLVAEYCETRMAEFDIVP